MIQHRYRTAAFLGRWCASRGEALEDALRAGLAQRDDAAPEGVAWLAPTVIEMGRAAVSDSQYCLDYPGEALGPTRQAGRAYAGGNAAES
jgi:hypothetical protein